MMTVGALTVLINNLARDALSTFDEQSIWRRQPVQLPGIEKIQKKEGNAFVI
ncbi:hypothetical protein ACYSNR_03900 [Enterococcus sp. LJL128]